MNVRRGVASGDEDAHGYKSAYIRTTFENYVRYIHMSRIIILALAALLFSSQAFAGATVRVLPRVQNVEVDGQTEVAVKRMPIGSLFVLTVNKGQDVRHYEIQWYKDGIPLQGEVGQELRYPIATPELAGVYTVKMSSPCASVMSKPIQVHIENRPFQLNTEMGGTHDGVAGRRTLESASPVFQLLDCKPNPVSDRTQISFTTSESAPVVLKVVDLNGNVVATLVNDVVPAGTHSVEFNTREHNMASELYYYVLSAPGFTATKPLMLIK